LTKVIT